MRLPTFFNQYSMTDDEIPKWNLVGVHLFISMILISGGGVGLGFSIYLHNSTRSPSIKKKHENISAIVESGLITLSGLILLIHTAMRAWRYAHIQSQHNNDDSDDIEANMVRDRLLQ